MTWWAILIFVVVVLFAALLALDMWLQHREKMAGADRRTS
jgi:hypothetical protein